ncbi:hypothetical protein CC1G_11720 [Coprinopsis cinerea okayama7|uniref:Uncharacterized protein n=1 Tax=Coprinopsis cinerea (strain Okayama-7 / 130 / ATCC MYA-4618 / FGSC 9003) TaxID=240176 RepID=A8NJW8_COPC7|nr:hypothetical protein CC1G_11720 [Coprinopsis cinerea okayama7\|eukprot:XP_001834311.2 hypothetical protein CC1G_11720 [Coprinopsis cinerea okayama7\
MSSPEPDQGAEVQTSSVWATLRRFLDMIPMLTPGALDFPSSSSSIAYSSQTSDWSDTSDDESELASQASENPAEDDQAQAPAPPAVAISAAPAIVSSEPPFRFKYPAPPTDGMPRYIPPPPPAAPSGIPRGRGRVLVQEPSSPVTAVRNPTLPVRLELVARLAADHTAFEHLKPEVDSAGVLSGEGAQLVEQRLSWSGPMSDLKDVIAEIPLMTTQLTVKDCDLTIEDVLIIISSFPYLEALDVRDVIGQGADLPPVTKDAPLRSLTITSKTSLDGLFNNVRLPSLVSISLRLLGDGMQTDLAELFAIHGSELLTVRLRGHFPAETKAMLRELRNVLPRTPSVDIGHVCQSMRPRRRFRGSRQ